MINKNYFVIYRYLITLLCFAALHTLTVCEEDNQTFNTQVCKSAEIQIDGCVLGVSTWLSIPLYNPTENHIKLFAQVRDETVNGSSQNASSILFKEDCILEPYQQVVWGLGICGRAEGVLRCVINLQLLSIKTNKTLITHLVPIIASISLPQVTIGDSDIIDMGIMHEGFQCDESLSVHNHSNKELAVIVSITQTFTNMFYFKDEHAKKITDVEVACVLSPGKNAINIGINAPKLSSIGEDRKKAAISCNVVVKLDSPELPRPVLASKSIGVTVVAVLLHVSRSCIPLQLSTSSHSHASCDLTLKNPSCIPLSLRFKWNVIEREGHKSSVAYADSLAIVPDTFVIQPNTQRAPVIVFTPLGHEVEFKATIVIVVEPWGIEYEVPVEVKSMLHCGEDKRQIEGCSATDKEDFNDEKGFIERTAAKADLPKKAVIANAIEANKSLVAFGCIKSGMTVYQKLIFSNRDSSNVTLNLGISGSSNYSVEPSDTSSLNVSKSTNKNSSIIVPAKGMTSVNVAYSPKRDDVAESAILVCKTKGQETILKYSVSILCAPSVLIFCKCCM